MRLSRAHRLDLFVVAGAVLVFVVLRVPLLVEPGVRLGWNSDSAIFGLIAREMSAEQRVTWLYWGQDYLGTLTSMLALAIGEGAGLGVGPLSLRLAASAQMLVGLLLFWDALRRVWGRVAAHLMLLWLVAGPAYFFKLSYAPNAEQMFFVGAVLFWFVMRFRFTHAMHWAVLGLLAAIGWWAHRGATMVVPAAVTIAGWYDDQWRRPRRAALGAIALLLGTAAGAIPLVLGHRQEDQILYAPVTAEWTLHHVVSRIAETLRRDVWQFLGADSHPWSFVVAIVLLLLAVIGMRRVTRTRDELLTVGVAATMSAFWVLTTTAYSGAPRYLALLLPIALALAARGIESMWQQPRIASRAAAAALAIVIAIHFHAGRFTDVRTIAAGRGEQHEEWPGGFDPRPALGAIEAGGYQACYADFWTAYKLEWLSGVPFIPYRSVDRTQRRSLQLASSRGRKCFVDERGSVRSLDGATAERLRAETVAHWNRRAVPLPSLR